MRHLPFPKYLPTFHRLKSGHLTEQHIILPHEFHSYMCAHIELHHIIVCNMYYTCTLSVTIQNELGCVKTNVVRQFKRPHGVASSQLHGCVNVLRCSITYTCTCTYSNSYHSNT